MKFFKFFHKVMSAFDFVAIVVVLLGGCFFSAVVVIATKNALWKEFNGSDRWICLLTLAAVAWLALRRKKLNS